MSIATALVVGGLVVHHESTGGALTKSSREIMEILEAFDLTRCAWSAAELAGGDAETVAR